MPMSANCNAQEFPGTASLIPIAKKTAVAYTAAFLGLSKEDKGTG
jgi:hypothetical protein